MRRFTRGGLRSLIQIDENAGRHAIAPVAGVSISRVMKETSQRKIWRIPREGNANPAGRHSRPRPQRKPGLFEQFLDIVSGVEGVVYGGLFLILAIAVLVEFWVLGLLALGAIIVPIGAYCYVTRKRK